MGKKESKKKYRLDISFETIDLPPVNDILVIGKKAPQGKYGVMKSFNFLSPDTFELIEIKEHDENAEAVIINKRILRKIQPDHIINILKQYVFPFIGKEEMIKVNVDLVIIQPSIEITN
jgi:hypothetical protein